MPEMIEVEYYRRVAERTVGRTDRGGRRARRLVPQGRHDRVERSGATLAGRTVTGTRRIGKLLLLDTDAADPRPALRDDRPAARRRRRARSSSSSTRAAARTRRGSGSRCGSPAAATCAWSIRVASVACVLDPDTRPPRHRRARRPAAGLPRPPWPRAERRVKAWLLDQSHIAGVGNLLADEILWRAGLDPARPGRSLDPRRGDACSTARSAGRSACSPSEAAATPATSRSHGCAGATCPRDGAPLQRRTIGGRTTYSCPRPPALTRLGRLG